MRNCSRMSSDVTVGLDLGDRKSHVVYIGRDGEVLGEARVATTPRALEKEFGGFDGCRVAIEVGPHSSWVSRLLERCGHEVIVSNPRQVPLIFRNANKTDRADAECLGRLARFDPGLLRPIRHRGEDVQKDLALLRSRDVLVRSRAKLISHARSIVKCFGARLRRCSAPAFHRRVREEIPEGIRPALEPIVSVIELLTAKIGAFDRKIESLSERKYDETRYLRQVHGVGPVTALAFILTLEDPGRFKKSRQVGPFLGMTRRKDDSGERESQLRITKAGDCYLRRLLVGCAQYILGPFGADSDLRRHGERIAQRGGKNAKKRAAVAVACKLGVLLHHLWATGEVYEPLRNTNRMERVRTHTA